MLCYMLLFVIYIKQNMQIWKTANIVNKKRQS